MDKVPLMPPPDGQTSDLHRPYNSIQIGTIVGFSITIFFATILLVLRYIQAYKLSKRIELNLCLVTISYGMSFAYFLTIIKMMKYGWGKHLWDIAVSDFPKFLSSIVPNTLIYLICPTITRMAMLSILYRINPSAIYRAIIIIIVVISLISTFVFCMVFGVPCNPDVVGATMCLADITKWHAIFNIVTDIAVVAVPIPTIHTLNLSPKQKVSVGCILALGSGVVICSIARLPYVLTIDKSNDPTYYEAALGTWSVIELNLGIICVCAVRIRELLVMYLPQVGQFLGRLTGSTRSALSFGTGGSQTLSQKLDKVQRSQSYQLHSIQRSRGDLDAVTTDSRTLRNKNGGVEHTNPGVGSSEESLTGRVTDDHV